MAQSRAHGSGRLGFEALVTPTYTVPRADCEVGRIAGFYSPSALNACGPGGWFSLMVRSGRMETRSAA